LEKDFRQVERSVMRITGGVTNYYIYGAGLLYEIDETPTTTNTAFYHYDCRGSTVTLTDGSGNPTDTIEYSSYGTTTYRAGTTDTPFLYNGQFGVQTDPNGLLFMRARYYNPYISRFLNPDPSGFAGGLNFYVFANGNPVSETDPFGLWTWDQVGSAALHFGEGVVVGAVVTAGVILAAPEIAAGGAAALVWAGVSEATAATVAVGAVDTGLLVAGGTGLGLNAADTYVNIQQGNWNAVAYNAGNLVGGYGVGVSPFAGSTSGGRYLADSLGEIGGSGASGAPPLSPIDLPGAWNYEVANRLQLNAPNSDLSAWAASAPTPFSGGTSATGIASGIGSGADLVNQYGSTVVDWLGNAVSSSSSTGKH
jgi:RHS repeat-associated protein